MPVRRARLDAETPSSDEELVERCLKGEEGAWTALVERYGVYVYAIAAKAYRLDITAADDVFQDVWVRLYDGLSGYSGTGRFRSWLRAVVVSACREHLRRAARGGPIQIAEPEAAPLDDIDGALDVRHAVSALGEPCRGTIALYFYAGLTQAEVAGRLGVPSGTVAARLSRCLKRLRDALQEPAPPSPSSE
jgi:RNA polymerase sigma-70 factor (ECF subfamily)